MEKGKEEQRASRFSLPKMSPNEIVIAGETCLRQQFAKQET